MQGNTPRHKDHSLAKGFFVTYSRIPSWTWYHKTLGNLERLGVLLLSSSLQQDPLDTWGGKEPLGISGPTSCSVKV